MTSLFEFSEQFQNELLKLDSSKLSNDEKREKVIDLVNTLSITNKRFYLDLINKQKKRQVKVRCQDKDKGKFALLEITNMNQEFTHQMMFVSMIHYILNRFEESKMQGRFKKHVRRFLDEVFNTHDTNHLGSIYDLCYAGKDIKDKRDIPILSKELRQELVPSFEQWNNAYTYMKHNYEEMQTMTTTLFGTRPDMLATVTCHGVFRKDKTEDQVSDYRIKYAENIDDTIYEIPVGKDVLIAPYRDIREETVVFHPDDPEYEELSRRNIIMKRIDRKGIINRVKKDKIATEKDRTKMDMIKNTIDVINGYTTDTKINTNDKETIDELKHELIKSLHENIDNLANNDKSVIEFTDNENNTDNLLIDKTEIKEIIDELKIEKF